MSMIRRQAAAAPNDPEGKRKPKLSGPVLLRREMVAFLPAAALAGLWFGLEGMTLVGLTALVVAWMSRPLALPDEDEGAAPAPSRPQPQRAEAEVMLDAAVQESLATGRGTACLVVGLDDSAAVARQLSRTEFETFLRAFGDRICGVLRNSDRIALLEGERFAIILTPTQRLDLEGMIQLSGRLQTACDAPFSISARSVNVTSHIGFCLMSRAPEATGKALLAAAETAAQEACRNGPGAIRAFTAEQHRAHPPKGLLADKIAVALEDGRIVAFFQPQICTDTGAVSGMQAVPRWLDRERGILTEADILPGVAQLGLHLRLAEVLLFQGFTALRAWGGLATPPGPVSLPLGQMIATDPKMFERLKWELDRFEIAPDRLRLVLLKGVTAQIDDEVVLRNLSRCAALGCRIELAGFGTGPISVAALRRTGAERIRIDRAFVRNIDRDPDQQRLVAAIISFAEGLGLQTLADGAATIGEHAMLAQLGCTHVQGKAIAQPMPLDEIDPWLSRHEARLSTASRRPHRRSP